MTPTPGDDPAQPQPTWALPAPAAPPPVPPTQPAQGQWSGGQPGGWPHAGWPPPAPPGRNGFAVAALVLGILPVLGGLLGLIFGLVGRSQARRTGQRGATMATVGACLGAAWMLLFGGFITWGILSEPERDDTGAVVAGGDESAFELKVGDCLRTLDLDREISTVPVVPCAEPHDGEVYDSFELPAGDYPGDEAVVKAADTGCAERFQAFVGVPYEDSALQVVFYHPSRRSWTLANDRQIHCMIESDATTGSARGTAG